MRHMSRKNYKNLIAWQKAHAMVPEVYQALAQLPREEKYALADQIRRAAISVPANIAEGHGRQHQKEFCQFLGIARGSLSELETLLILAQDLGYLPPTKLEQLEAMTQEIGKLINGLMRTLT